VAFRNGAPVRLTDVATAIDSAENEKQAAWANKQPAVIPEYSAATGCEHH